MGGSLGPEIGVEWEAGVNTEGGGREGGGARYWGSGESEKQKKVRLWRNI